MVSVVHYGRIDIHNYRQRLKRATRFLESHPEISLENKNRILWFLDRIKTEGKSGKTGFICTVADHHSCHA